MHQTQKSVVVVVLTKVVCVVLFLLTERAKKGRTGNESNIFVKLIFGLHNTQQHTQTEVFRKVRVGFVSELWYI